MPRTQLRYHEEVTVKAVDGEFRIKQQLIIATSKFSAGSTPTTHDLAVLDGLLDMAIKSGWSRPEALSIALKPRDFLFKTMCRPTDASVVCHSLQHARSATKTSTVAIGMIVGRAG